MNLDTYMETMIIPAILDDYFSVKDVITILNQDIARDSGDSGDSDFLRALFVDYIVDLINRTNKTWLGYPLVMNSYNNLLLAVEVETPLCEDLIEIVASLNSDTNT